MPFASLPSLRDLRVGFHTQRDSFFISAVVHSASSLRSLTITHPPTNLPHIFPLDFPVLASVSPTLIHLTCEPGPGRLNALRHVVPSEEDDYLPLLSTMTNLKTSSIILLPTLAFFAALRTLPRLVSLRVFVTAPIAASEVSRSLADASFWNLELTMANVAAWDKGRVEMVGAAADARRRDQFSLRGVEGIRGYVRVRSLGMFLTSADCSSPPVLAKQN